MTPVVLLITTEADALFEAHRQFLQQQVFNGYGGCFSGVGKRGGGGLKFKAHGGNGSKGTRK